MITKISELLKELVDRETEILAEQGIVHAPTIGEMYEGLSAELLDRALPLEGTPLKIVRGFIRPKQGGPLSSEIDCMIVLGEGEEVPRTQKYIYPVERVLVVFEIKKTLTRQELVKTIEKTNRYGELCEHMVHNGHSDEAFARTIGKRPLLCGAPEVVGEENVLLADSVIVGANLPLRVVLDYSGYKTIRGFIKALSEVLTELSEKDESGTMAHPGYWPDLIVGPNFEVVKLFGSPYSVKESDDGDMSIFAISQAPHRLLLLEMILWRLGSYLNRFIPIYSDFAAPILATVCTLNIKRDEPMLTWISPEDAQVSVLQIDHDEAAKDLTQIEMKVATMFMGVAQFLLSDEEVWAGLEITEGELRTTVASLAKFGVCFLHDDVAYGTYKTLGIAAGVGRVVCAENCRGTLGRESLLRVAEAAQKLGQNTVPVTHVTTRDPLDFSSAVVTVSEISTVDAEAKPGHFDWIRFHSTEIAKQILDDGN